MRWAGVLSLAAAVVLAAAMPTTMDNSPEDDTCPWDIVDDALYEIEQLSDGALFCRELLDLSCTTTETSTATAPYTTTVTLTNTDTVTTTATQQVTTTFLPSSHFVPHSSHLATVIQTTTLALTDTTTFTATETVSSTTTVTAVSTIVDIEVPIIAGATKTIKKTQKNTLTSYVTEVGYVYATVEATSPVSVTITDLSTTTLSNYHTKTVTLSMTQTATVTATDSVSASTTKSVTVTAVETQPTLVLQTEVDSVNQHRRHHTCQLGNIFHDHSSYRHSYCYHNHHSPRTFYQHIYCRTTYIHSREAQVSGRERILYAGCIINFPGGCFA